MGSGSVKKFGRKEGEVGGVQWRYLRRRGKGDREAEERGGGEW